MHQYLSTNGCESSGKLIWMCLRSLSLYLSPSPSRCVVRVRACVACTELTTDNVLEAYDFPAHIDGWAIDSLLEPLRSAGASTQVLLSLLVVVTHSLARTHTHTRLVLLLCVYVMYYYLCIIVVQDMKVLFLRLNNGFFSR